MSGDPEVVGRIVQEAELGRVDAMFALGVLYSKGCGLPRDYDKAIEWLERARDLGDADAGRMIQVVIEQRFFQSCEDRLRKER
jgi:TPR repeat protein